MKVEVGTIKQLLVTEAPNLDPVRVMLENYEPGQGRITITCYGRAWTAAWFSMSGSTIEAFVARVDAGYILGNLTSHMAPSLKKNKAHDEAYLTRIIKVVQAALSQ